MITIDKILGKPLLHNHSEKLNLSGGTITGTVTFPATGMILKDSNGLNPICKMSKHNDTKRFRN